ncbi:hypothetical protein ASPCADRAFT_205749 [Aspergillus carbonarius ITEM 5010]|uniref:Uncharacterized protein n=1 Tax=Aspergillus carbonarius (strain ITEM 5010) TaxID=602072 RepID=A0A1R3RR76_ASPC5|nr:hypothetical protein ASPCADRAFT_205749 [Aspergillus carbonarius ITEM 5010]
MTYLNSRMLSQDLVTDHRPSSTPVKTVSTYYLGSVTPTVKKHGAKSPYRWSYPRNSAGLPPVQMAFLIRSSQSEPRMGNRR